MICGGQNSQKRLFCFLKAEVLPPRVNRDSLKVQEKTSVCMYTSAREVVTLDVIGPVFTGLSINPLFILLIIYEVSLFLFGT